jgi:hypothetical protein
MKEKEPVIVDLPLGIVVNREGLGGESFTAGTAPKARYGAKSLCLMVSDRNVPVFSRRFLVPEAAWMRAKRKCSHENLRRVLPCGD